MDELHESFYSLPLVALDVLPNSVATRIARLESSRPDGWRYSLTAAGTRLDLDGVELSYFPGSYGPSFVAVRRARTAFGYTLLLPLLAGAGGLMACVLSLATTPVAWPWWAASASVALLGAGLAPRSRYV